MDVSITTLRAEISSWIDLAHNGEEVVITDRGTPVARLVAIDAAPLLDQLVQEGILAKPVSADRPSARGAKRVRSTGSVSELVSEQRR